ncbi:hypothetical protein LSAT2_008465 [Lamellibrachia satsuma]|nr:hypothetical protein LSAT2_008465 [Lamellibrachia satsuma]
MSRPEVTERLPSGSAQSASSNTETSLLPPTKRRRVLTGLKQCTVCCETTDNMRQHVEVVHLPYNFQPNAAFRLCEQQFGTLSPFRAHLAEPPLEDRQKEEIAPHFAKWANSMINLLDSTRRMALLDTFEGLVIFRKRRW